MVQNFEMRIYILFSFPDSVFKKTHEITLLWTNVKSRRDGEEKKKVKIVPASASRTEDAAFSKASTNQNLAFTLRKTLKTNYGQTKGSPTRQVTLLSFTPKADAATAITTLETEETP